MSQVTVIISEAWKAVYPGASIGILAMHNVTNPAQHGELDRRKEMLEARLRARFAGYDRAKLKALPAIQAYNAYYKRFKKTYHVLLQLESVVFQDKPIPRVAALVEAMFMAELENLFLTAGHDLSLVQMPLRVDVAVGNERFIQMNGQEQTLKAGDMFIADAEGILSSIVYGADQRTCMTAKTQQALFTVYAPMAPLTEAVNDSAAGIGEQAMYKHLRDIQENVTLIAPQAEVVLLNVYGAGR